jgi:spore coat polysaccharide biosynthesis protein SpsF (cytidylyltransferase family)
MLKVNERPMIHWQIQRVLQVPEIDKIIVATSTDSSDDVLVSYLKGEEVEVFRGNLHDVHSRFFAIIEKYNTTNTFVRLTADCPLTMPELLSVMLKDFKNSEMDYYSNTINPTYPDGLDIEIFTRNSFLAMSKYELSNSEKEHVTLKYRDLASVLNLAGKSHSENLSSLRWTVDYEDDLEFVRKIYERFTGNEGKFSLSDVLFLLRNDPELKAQQTQRTRNNSLDLSQENQE